MVGSVHDVRVTGDGRGRRLGWLEREVRRDEARFGAVDVAPDAQAQRESHRRDA
jgi:hypothetical protein